MSHLTVKDLYHALGNLMVAEPAAAERLVYLGKDPEGNPPAHAFTHELTPDGSGFAFAEVFDKPALVLWPGYPQAWEDDVTYADDDEEEE